MTLKVARNSKLMAGNNKTANPSKLNRTVLRLQSHFDPAPRYRPIGRKEAHE